MVIGQDVAAYGLFQIAFATLDTKLSRSLAALCRCESVTLTRAILTRMPFGQRLKLLQRAMQGHADDDTLCELGGACKLAQKVQKWRNARIHAEVRFNENRPALFGPSGPLRIDREECEQKIKEAIRAGIAMEAAVPHLVALKQDLEELLGDSEWD